MYHERPHLGRDQTPTSVGLCGREPRWSFEIGLFGHDDIADIALIGGEGKMRVMNTLDLDPEWGAIDLIEDVEKEFGIRFRSEEVEPCETVGDFYTVLCDRVPDLSVGGERCATSMAFYRIRRFLDPERTKGIKPSTPLPEDVAPALLFKALGRDTALRLPTIRHTWLGMVGGMLVSVGCIAGVFALLMGWWRMSGIAFTLAACGIPFIWVDRGRWPLGIATVGDLAQRTASLNGQMLRSDGERPVSRWEVLVALAAEHGALAPDEITASTFFHRKSLKLASA